MCKHIYDTSVSSSELSHFSAFVRSVSKVMTVFVLLLPPRGQAKNITIKSTDATTTTTITLPGKFAREQLFIYNNNNNYMPSFCMLFCYKYE